MMITRNNLNEILFEKTNWYIREVLAEMALGHEFISM